MTTKSNSVKVVFGVTRESPVPHKLGRLIASGKSPAVTVELADGGELIQFTNGMALSSVNGRCDRIKNYIATGKRTKPSDGTGRSNTRTFKSRVTVMSGSVIKLQSTLKPELFVTIDLSNNSIAPNRPEALPELMGIINYAMRENWQLALTKHAVEYVNDIPVFNGYIYGDFKSDKAVRDNAMNDIMQQIVKSGQSPVIVGKLISSLDAGLKSGGTGKLTGLFEKLNKPVKTVKSVKSPVTSDKMN
jgi:hypothetical protein